MVRLDRFVRACLVLPRRRAALARVLVVTLFLAACATPAPSPPRLLELPDRPVRRDLPVLATIVEGGETIGHVLPLRVTVSAEEGDALELVFDERHSIGSGRVWRASEWIAALQAVLVSRIQPRGLQIAFAVEGDIDGPSAGALMTVGVLSAIHGDTIDTGISMTGTINPDGSIGAVSNIPAKVRGAASHGLHTVLIPDGLRLGLDLHGPDVVELGQSLGVDVREVGDVSEAYEAMTGRSLHGAERLAEIPPFESTFVRALDVRTKWWQALYERHRDAAPDVEAPPGTAAGLDRARDLAEQARLLLAGGKPAAAWATMVAAARAAAVARFLPEVQSVHDASGPGGVRGWIGSHGHVGRNLRATLDRIEATRPVTFDDHVAMAVAYAYVIEAHSLEQSADAIVDDLEARRPTGFASAQDALSAAVSREIESAILQIAATDFLELAEAVREDEAPIELDLALLARGMRNVADANVELFESLILGRLARRSGRSLEAVRNDFARQSQIYREVLSVEALRGVADRRVTDDLHHRIAGVGLDIWRFVGGAELLATHYSLAVEIDPATMRAQRFTVTPPLEAMYESSSKQILGSLRALADAGIDHHIVLASYEIGIESARAARANGDGPTLMTGLRHMWGAQVVAETFLISLAGSPVP